MPPTQHPGSIATTVLGIGWYRPEDWERLLQVISDRFNMQDSYAEWLADAKRVERQLTAQGTQVRRVFVEPDELAGWCLIHGLAPDGKGRASFVSEKVS